MAGPRSIKDWMSMSSEELAEATAEFDREMDLIAETKPLPPELQEKWDRARGVIPPRFLKLELDDSTRELLRERAETEHQTEAELACRAIELFLRSA